MSWPPAGSEASPTPLQRLRAAVATLGCSPSELVALTVLVAGALVGLGILWLGSRSADAPVPAATASPLAMTHEAILVHVAGEVAAPGIYELRPDARVADALEAAGGALPDAALDAINLARPLSDGEQLVVPNANATKRGPEASESQGRLNLNQATPAELEELPGIGPVLAERIIAHREAVGSFQSIEQLKDVTGIGDKTFAALAELVTV